MSSRSINRIWKLASIISLGRIQTVGHRTGKSLYLTFDDGPHPEHTPPILDLLETHGARAQFFLIGSSCQKYPELVKRIREQGHTIGNHSMSHPQMKQLAFREQWRELASMETSLPMGLPWPRIAVRPPRGEITLAILMYSMIRARSIVLWSQDSLDGIQGPNEVIQRFRDYPVVAGDRILFHDDAGVAGQALATLLPEWRRQGFRLDAVS